MEPASRVGNALVIAARTRAEDGVTSSAPGAGEISIAAKTKANHLDRNIIGRSIETGLGETGMGGNVQCGVNEDTLYFIGRWTCFDQ